MISRRSVLFGLGAALAAPAIVRASVIMPVRSITVPKAHLMPCDGRSVSAADFPDLFKATGCPARGPTGSVGTFRLPELAERVFRNDDSVYLPYMRAFSDPNCASAPGDVIYVDSRITRDLLP